MLTAQQVHILDANAAFFGVPTQSLMEKAGTGVAQFVQKMKIQPQRILVLCGPGNNGGDGMVAARILSKHYTVDVYLVKKPKTDLAKDNFSRLQTTSATILQCTHDELMKKISKYDLIIDAMLGIGLKGVLKPPYDTIIESMNDVSATIISVDVPTGMETSTVVRPDFTLTFHDKKKGMSKKTCGIITIIDIGIPTEATTFVGPGQLTTLFPRSPSESHKGDNGSVLIVGGGPYCGAPALAGMGALRAGADLVFIATPQQSYQPIASFSPNLITQPLGGNILSEKDIVCIEPLIKRCNAVVLGPGLGIDQQTKRAVSTVIQHVIQQEKKLVLDADAILHYSSYSYLDKIPTVITPHEGEFFTLTGVRLPKAINKRISLVKEWSKKLGVTIVLKGPIDIICYENQVMQNKTHNPGMTVGGTGDVLSGIIGALLSKELSGFDAGCIATFLNGLAGNHAYESKSYGMLATDVIDAIPIVLKKYL